MERWRWGGGWAGVTVSGYRPMLVLVLVMMGRVDIIVGLHYTARLLDHSCCNSLLKQTNCYLVGLVWVRLRGEKNKRKREKKTMTMAFLVRKKQQQQRKRKRKRKREEMEDVEFNWVSM